MQRGESRRRRVEGAPEGSRANSEILEEWPVRLAEPLVGTVPEGLPAAGCPGRGWSNVLPLEHSSGSHSRFCLSLPGRGLSRGSALNLVPVLSV